MLNPNKETKVFKTLLKSLTEKYHTLIAIILFIIGIALRLVSVNKPGAFLPIIGEIGTFLAAVIAIPFIYDKFIKQEDRKIFLSDLDELLENKLREKNNASIQVYEEGRVSIHDKVSLFKDAQQEIIVIATAARSFINTFDSRPHHEFRLPVEECLRRGVNFSIYLLDPHGNNTLTYALDTQTDEELIPKINRSLEKLVKLREEFRSLKSTGKFNLYTYSQLPTCYMLLVDPKRSEGRMHYCHYLKGLTHADLPVFEVHKYRNPTLFNKYHDYANRLIKTSKIFTNKN